MKLPVKFTTALWAYCATFALGSYEMLLDTAKFMLNVWRNNRFAVVRLACGLGKSTVAVCLIASQASRKNRFILVCRDRATVREKAATIGALMGGLNHVGIVWGWNADECHTLCSDKGRTYKKCLRGEWSRTCSICVQNDKCNYFLSQRNLMKPVVVTTASSFLSMCERGQDFSKANVIIDEDLSTFAGVGYSAEELRKIDAFFSMSSDPMTAGAVSRILPLVNLEELRCGCTGDSSDIHYYKSSSRFGRGFFSAITDYARKNSRYLEANGLDELVFGFILFFRTTDSCVASYASVVRNNTVEILKNRLSLAKFTSCKRLMLLDGSAGYSMNDLGAELPVFTCNELGWKHLRGHLNLHVVIANPTQSRIASNTEMAMGMLLSTGSELFGSILWEGKAVLVPHNVRLKSEALADNAITRLHSAMPTAEIVKAPAWSLRGTNDYGHCDTAFLVSAGTFTTVVHAGLCACLRTGTDLPISRLMNADGSPRMHKGRFVEPSVQDAYARNSVAAIYQAIGRTAIRNGGDATVFLAIPSPEWLVALYSLRPFNLDGVQGANRQTESTFRGVVLLMAEPPGTRFGKSAVAAIMGYTGTNAWRDKGKSILYLLKGIYQEDPGDNRYITKTGVS